MGRTDTHQMRSSDGTKMNKINPGKLPSFSNALKPAPVSCVRPTPGTCKDSWNDPKMT